MSLTSSRSSSWTMAMVPSGQFFWSSLSKLEANENIHVDEPSRYNLKPRSAGRDTEIKASCLSGSSTSHHRVNTYFRSVWNSGYLDLVLTAIVRFIRKRFRCSPEGLYPEQSARCSEALEEDALVRCR